MAVKNGLPDTDFSEMNRNYILNVMEGETVIDGKPATDFSRMNRKYIEAVAEENAVDIEEKTITENGTYTAEEGKAFSPVTVNVAGSGGYDSLLFSVTAKLTFNVSGTDFNHTEFSTNWVGYLYTISDGETLMIENDEGMYLPYAQTIYYIYVPITDDTPGGVIAFDPTVWDVTVTSGDAEVTTMGNNTLIIVTGDAVISAVKL